MYEVEECLDVFCVFVVSGVFVGGCCVRVVGGSGGWMCLDVGYGFGEEFGEECVWSVGVEFGF